MNEDPNVKKEMVFGYPSKNRSLEDERSQLHSRNKRFLSYPRYVEVMVTTDAKMVRHHGQNLQHYVLTLMSIVAAIYKDSSIGNLINIVIVKLIIIHNEQEGPVISFNAATTLRNFCLWQQTQNVLDDSHPSHHDTAVLITREDICGAKEKCDTLGLAELGTLCDPLRSCSISEENGLSAAFTVAHELGHVFNVPHDDSFKCKEAGIKHQYHVMAPTLNYHTSPWTWSKCSQKYITEFLEPRNGGKYCVGRRMKFRSCNTDSCPKGQQDFREKQCSDFDGQHFNINGLSPNVRWLPKYSGIAIKDRCKLYCRVAGTTNFYQLKDRVADGTPCGTETNDICVQGLCRQAGCDHVLNSKAKRDKCGVCGGDNSSCRTMAGVFNSAHYGLHRRKITCIRKSDRMIVSDQSCDHLPLPPFVTEKCNTDCELRWHIIGKSDCSSHCGQGYRSLDVRCMKYSVHKGQTVPVDDHYCSDQLKPPTREPCHGDCVLIRWHYSEWSQCSRSCGGGEKSRESYCVNNFGHRLADRECQELPRVMLENCNEFSCPIWVTSEWSECLVTCGRGTKQRQVWCQLKDDRLSDGFCNLSTKPESLRPCELHRCASWQVGPWGSCTATCGQGYQRRAVQCVSELFSAVVDDRECRGDSHPGNRQDCIVTPCLITSDPAATSLPALPMANVAQWRHGSWTPCSVTCGRGNQARYVSCRDAHNEIADESYCAHLPRPAEMYACFSPCGEWQAGNWSPCSASCGHGKTTRQVSCVNYHQPIDENFCDPEVRPLAAQACNLAACPPTYSHFPSSSEQPSHFSGQNFPLTHKPEDNQNQGGHLSIRETQWRTGPWGSCSRSCAGGLQHRAVVCQDGDGQSASLCDAASKPPESKPCDLGPCPFWSYGSWGECTQTCGGGIKSRFVICQFPDGQVLPEHNCEMLNKPPSVTQCQVHPCPDEVSWQRGPWKSCSVTCGVGIMERRVECMDENGWPSDLCLKRLKPDAQKKCYVYDCKSFTSCKDIQIKNNITKDGDYYLNIKGRIIKIHCVGMHLENPKEYLSLVKGEEDNFSEVYGFRLQNPYECPFNGSRRKDCKCKNDYLAAGYTVFSKIRIDLTSMQVKTTDLLFSQTLVGQAVPFATAGDCYSAARCPQGQFSINLAGTGMKISSTAKWLAQGRYASVTIHRSQDGTKVSGRCGGFCGKCVPHMTTGLPIQVT
ncbi:A disintegrin and metalloproteinase with thrombospondin motifs 20 [Fukomys damarensis]|uniref:A disintegrin and metalloproteinase with thrombospondin motifs 20 n=1 Tax=Fukomys damarensis TaxID=885580 RepID=A0A091D7B4_FUKDA|nr:A disintegrin and metalloproteinase with thrombospondin motifs 20 [Fukomys damarensis]